jgi:hypothetical protein
MCPPHHVPIDDSGLLGRVHGNWYSEHVTELMLRK